MFEAIPLIPTYDTCHCATLLINFRNNSNSHNGNKINRNNHDNSNNIEIIIVINKSICNDGNANGSISNGVLGICADGLFRSTWCCSAAATFGCTSSCFAQHFVS